MNHFPIEIKDGYLIKVENAVDDEDKYRIIVTDKYNDLTACGKHRFTKLIAFNNEKLETELTHLKLHSIYGRSYGSHCLDFDTTTRELLWVRDDEKEKEIDETNLREELSKCKTLAEVIEIGTKYFETNSDISHEDAKKTAELLSVTAIVTSMMGIDVPNLD